MLNRINAVIGAHPAATVIAAETLALVVAIARIYQLYDYIYLIG